MNSITIPLKFFNRITREEVKLLVLQVLFKDSHVDVVFKVVNRGLLAASIEQSVYLVSLPLPPKNQNLSYEAAVDRIRRLITEKILHNDYKIIEGDFDIVF